MKYRILWNTILKKGIKSKFEPFGVYFITGRQGSGKSYYATLFMYNHYKEYNKIKTNIKSLRLPVNTNTPIMEYFNTIDELYTDIDKDCLYIIDEIARKYDRNSKTDTQFYAWLNQSRKHRRVVLLITQEWRELPMWIRRPARYCITTQKFIGSIFKTTVGDAENMTFDKDEGEYICPPVYYLYYKRNKKVATLYDTFESINKL